MPDRTPKRLWAQSQQPQQKHKETVGQRRANLNTEQVDIEPFTLRQHISKSPHKMNQMFELAKISSQMLPPQENSLFFA